MTLTRSFKDTVKSRATRDTDFRQALLKESINCMLSGDMETGKRILRDYINATIGFEELGSAANKSPKSLMRMFSRTGNPTAANLFHVIQKLQEKEEVVLKVYSNN